MYLSLSILNSIIQIIISISIHRHPIPNIPDCLICEKNISNNEKIHLDDLFHIMPEHPKIDHQ